MYEIFKKQKKANDKFFEEIDEMFSQKNNKLK